MTRRSHGPWYLRLGGPPGSGEVWRVDSPTCESGRWSCDSSPSAITACWALTAVIVLLGYRPGGPVDVVVGLAAAGPVLIAFAGDHLAAGRPRRSTAFAAMIWLGLGTLLVLVPSIVDVSDQLVQARRPDAAAVGRGGLPVGPRAARHEPVRRLRDRPARPRRGRDAAPAPGPRRGRRDGPRGRRRDRRSPRSRWPTSSPSAITRRHRRGSGRRPATASRRRATARSRSGRARGSELHLMADLDGRPIGSVDLAGDRAGTNFRWLAYAASTQELGLHGEARIGERGVGPPAVQRVAAERARATSPTARSTSRRSRPRWARRSATRPSSTASTSSRAPGPRTAGSRSTARRSGGRSRRSPGSSATMSWAAGGASSTTGSSPTTSSAG